MNLFIMTASCWKLSLILSLQISIHLNFYIHVLFLLKYCQQFLILSTLPPWAITLVSLSSMPVFSFLFQVFSFNNVLLNFFFLLLFLAIEQISIVIHIIKITILLSYKVQQSLSLFFNLWINHYNLKYFMK